MDRIEKIARIMKTLRDELRKVFVGQDVAVEQLLIALLSGGHGLLTGVPGLGKTKLVKSLASLLGLSFRRIQFTPDLMPADIIGGDVLEQDPETGRRSFRFQEGPLFTQMLLADEINRTPPKTQAALLEAMGELQVTSGGVTRPLPRPFFVLATQNQLELEGTYPLPEAQLDRFLLNVVMDYLSPEEEARMVAATTAQAEPALAALLNEAELLDAQRLCREIVAPESVVEEAVRLCAATRPGTATCLPRFQEFVKWGAGSRAAQSLILAGKGRALLQGRGNVSHEDLRELLLPVLRHRVILNFRAAAEGITVTQLLQELPFEK
ncbi:MAG: MoxR family ATPase [Lentisphaeria bacterium]|nr:MoxR family ATPase [Lentisphaeria bacterium]